MPQYPSSSLILECVCVGGSFLTVFHRSSSSCHFPIGGFTSSPWVLLISSDSWGPSAICSRLCFGHSSQWPLTDTLPSLMMLCSPTSFSKTLFQKPSLKTSFFEVILNMCRNGGSIICGLHFMQCWQTMSFGLFLHTECPACLRHSAGAWGCRCD